MKKTISNIILTTFCLIMFYGCSSVETVKSDDVEQRIIFPQYFIHYNADDSTTVATAKFNVNNGAGAALKLAGGSNVKYDGEKLSGAANKSDNSYQYTLRRHGALNPKSAFLYTNNDGQEFTNQLNINSFEVNTAKVELSKSVTNTVKFSGKTLDENETLECVMTQCGNEENSFSVSCYQDNDNSHMIIIFGEDIEAPAGEYEIQFVRRNSSSEISAMERGGLWETEYLSKKVKALIIN